MILYGSIEANNGKPMMAILDLRPVEGKLIINDMQKVNSVYTKDKPVGSLIRSAVMYADKKRTIPLLRSMGLHIGPKDLLQNGSMGRITYGSKSVKLDGVPFREVVNLSGKSTEETLTETTVGDDGNIYLPGGPVPEAVKRMRAKNLDRDGSAAYDGGNQKGAVDYEQRNIGSETEETYLRNEREGRPGTNAEDGGRKRSLSETLGEGQRRGTQKGGGEEKLPKWAKGHVVETTKTEGSNWARNAVSQYTKDIYFVSHAVLQDTRKNQRFGVTTVDGTVFLSDQIPDHLGTAVGHHEVVHVARRKRFAPYLDFLADTVSCIDRGEYSAQDMLDALADAKYDKPFMELSVDEVESVYDELNAYAWGFHRDTPERARELFKGVFRNYNDYIHELDAIMEQMRLGNLENYPVEDVGILTETAVGDDGNIYLPGGPVPEAVKRMRAQQEDRSQKAGGPERFFADKTDGLMNRMTQEEIRAVQSIGSKSINDFAAEDFKATEGLARRYWVEMGEKSPFFRAWFGDWRVNDQTPVERATELGSDRGQVQNKDTGWTVNVSRKVFEETKTQHSRNTVMARHYLPYINDIVKKAVLLDSYTMEVGKEKSVNSLLMHSMYAVADIGNGPEVLKLFVEEMNNPNSSNTGKRAYKLLNIKRQQPGVEGSGRNPSLITQTAGIKSVADLFEAVKRADKNFRPGVSSKVVDEYGRPMAVYHGTDRGFWSFDPELGAYWFSREIDYAEAMAEERGGDRVLSAYISMKNPMRISLPMGRFTDPAAEGPYIRRAKAEGYDGVIFDTDTDNPMMADTFYVVFRPEQIKSATENIGTFDLNNPDIRYSVEDEEVLTETEVGDDGNIYLPGGPVPEAVKRMRAKGLDRASSAAYDGENQKEAVDYEQGGIESGNEETDLQAVRNGRQGTSAEDRRGKSEVLEAFRGNESRDTQRSQSKREIPEWARRHLTKEPKTKGCEQAKLAGSQYVGEVYLVKHDALQEARSENNKVVWGMTENGTVFLSDQVPDDIGITVGYHEVVHVAKQQDFHAYTDFFGANHYICTEFVQSGVCVGHTGRQSV